MTSTAQTSVATRGFFSTLFDFEFKSFLTLKFLKLIYMVLTGLALLMGAIYLVIGLTNGGFLALAAIVIAPIATLLYLVFLRIAFEMVALFFRIGENTSRIAAQASSSPAVPQAPALDRMPPYQA